MGPVNACLSAHFFLQEKEKVLAEAVLNPAQRKY